LLRESKEYFNAKDAKSRKVFPDNRHAVEKLHLTFS